MKKIVVVEDDRVLRQALVSLLEDHGYEVVAIEDFRETERQILESNASMVLLDILLPGANGQEILRNLRRDTEIPIVMLTSKTGDIDEILSMSYGADDYISKPYNPTLLLLKLEAIFRRMQPQDKKEEVEYRGITIHLLKSTMEYQGTECVLSRNEISILYYLIQNRGKIVSRNQLIDYLWDCSDFVDDNTLTVNINRLRKKLQEAGIENAIETRRKQGYILI